MIAFLSDSQGMTLAPGPLLLSFELASGILVHRKLESDFSAKAAESTTEMEKGGGCTVFYAPNAFVYS